MKHLNLREGAIGIRVRSTRIVAMIADTKKYKNYNIFDPCIQIRERFMLKVTRITKKQKNSSNSKTLS